VIEVKEEHKLACLESDWNC